MAVETPPTPKKSTSRILLIALLVICIILFAVVGGAGWYYYYGPCGLTAVENYFTDSQEIASDWDEAVAIAGSTARIALSDRVVELRDIKDQMEALDAPACASKYKADMLEHMDFTIKGFLSFMSQDDVITRYNFAKADNAIQRLPKDIETINACKPFCSSNDK